MSTPSNGSWNDNPESVPQGGYGGPAQGQPGFGQQSLGQGFGQQGGYAPQGEAPVGAPQSPPPGMHSQGTHGQGMHGQGMPPQQGNAAGSGLADLFSDFGFRKNLTESIASVAFIITLVWAVLDFVRVLANAWGTRDLGGTKVKNMGGFEAMVATLSGLAWLIFVVVVARLVFELCVNVARIARSKN